MRAKLLSIGILGFIVAGTAFVSVADLRIIPPAGDVSAFQAATNITFMRFVYQQNKQEQFVVSDANQVRELISTIRLEPGMAVNDIHFDRAIFRGPYGEISAHFCPKCFTIRNEKGEEVTYTMPKDFYAAFQTLALKHGWKLEEK